MAMLDAEADPFRLAAVRHSYEIWWVPIPGGCPRGGLNFFTLWTMFHDAFGASEYLRWSSILTIAKYNWPLLRSRLS